jgi:hypothetical protein
MLEVKFFNVLKTGFTILTFFVFALNTFAQDAKKAPSKSEPTNLAKDKRTDSQKSYVPSRRNDPNRNAGGTSVKPVPAAPNTSVKSEKKILPKK